MRYAFTICVILIGVGLLPALSAASAAMIANAAGCTLHEGSVNPCVIVGYDWGRALYTMGVLGWLMLISLPIAAVGGIGLILIVLIAAFRKLRTRR